MGGLGVLGVLVVKRRLERGGHFGFLVRAPCFPLCLTSGGPIIFGMRRPVFLLAALVLLFAVAPAWSGEVVRLRVEDTIQPASQQYIERALREAADRGASLVVMELDTPGGLVDTTRDITTAIATSPVPVVVFVTPPGARAASAISADVAVMAPGTNTGAAHPVGGQGENLPEDVRDKITNDAAAMVRSLAEHRGRNPEVAERTVLESISLTAEEALEEGLIDFIAVSVDDLLDHLDGFEVTRFNGKVEIIELGSPELWISSRPLPRGCSPCWPTPTSRTC